ncbi:MAG: T9SS type A sorting domain-containing protein [Aequorivita sp.]
MPKFLIFIVSLFWAASTYSQFGPQQIISNTADGTRAVFAADLDGDGYIDIVSANKFGNSLTWYKNLDGSGNFGPENLVALLNQTISVFAADLDNDGDVDILAISAPNKTVVWYENLDGKGNFSPQKVISNQVDGAFSVIAADIDGDGDMDVVLASDFLGLMWFENLGMGQFSGKKIIDSQIGNSRSVVAVDIDGDGDLDILGNGTGSNKIYWIENLDGLGNFGPRQIIDSVGLYANVVFAADIDGDGDMDVVFASNGDNEVAWYENLDGLGNYGPKRTITNTLSKAWTVYAADLDNDSDIDILATSVQTFGGEVVWFENLDGLGTFSEKKTISTEVQSPRSVIAADIDNDGDMDVVSASQNDDKIAWYKNATLGIAQPEGQNVLVYPNPTKGILFIDFKGHALQEVLVHDVMGKKVLDLSGDFHWIDMSPFQKGMYFLRIKSDQGSLVRKIIKE